MKNTIIGLKELRENMDTYISRIKRGKSFMVVRRSKPVFKISPIDEWGDDGEWETVVDFSEINEMGVPAKNVLKALKQANG